MSNKRLIESADKRIVHFIFNTQQQLQITPFSRKVSQMMDGELERCEAEDRDKFESYLERIIDDQLEEGETNPIKYYKNHNYELALENINNIAFSTADNPFFKSQFAKYYPEAIVIGSSGEILAHITQKNTESLKFKNLEFVENFRDEKLRINDDKKVKMNLKDFSDDEGIIIIFLVKTFDNRKEKPDEAAYA